MADWAVHVAREAGRYEDGLARLPSGADARQRQLVRVANAACGAGLASLMSGSEADAQEWFRRAAQRYRESFEGSPAGSWGRLIGAVKMRLLSGDEAGTASDSRWALTLRPGAAESPIGRYAAALAHLALGEDADAATLARSLEPEPADRFPAAVADALVALAEKDAVAYEDALGRVLRSFEEREEHLEDVPVADTVLALEALAERRDLAVHPASPLLP